MWGKTQIKLIATCFICANASGFADGGLALIGGENFGGSQPPTLALVIPNGASSQIIDLTSSLINSGSGWSGAGEVYSCSLNLPKNLGLVAGQGVFLSKPALALVIPNGASSQIIDLSSSLINSGSGWSGNGLALSCSLNSTGSLGLIGGEAGLRPSLALMIPNGSSSQIFDLTNTLRAEAGWMGIVGEVSGCSLNSSGSLGLIAGGSSNFAALSLIVPDGASSQITDLSSSLINSGPGWVSGGTASSCSLNSSGSVGLIGGAQVSNIPALALIIPNGASSQIFDLSSSLISSGSGWSGQGETLSCSLNSAGTLGLLAGQTNGFATPALALIIPDGASSQIIDLSSSLINSGPGWVGAGGADCCSLNSSGSLGLIGGNAHSTPALALIIPNGSSSQIIDLSNTLITEGGAGWTGHGIVKGCSLIDVEALTPTTLGAYTSSVQYTMMAESSALQAHQSYDKMYRRQGIQRANNLEAMGFPIPTFRKKDDLNQENATTKSLHHPAVNSQAPYAIWLMPFGDLLYQKAQGKTPSLTNQIAGTLLGFDAECGKQGVVGAAFGYAFNYANYGQHVGHAKINQETGVVYGSWNGKIGYISAALWGGGCQIKNERHSLLGTSKANINGYLLSPHIEGSAVIRTSKHFFYIEPFGMLDWANSWQKRFHEKGSLANLSAPSRHTSLLRSEAGLRFYETLETSRLDIFLLEKVSYINQTPFHLGNQTVTFVGGNVPFPVAIGSTHTQNLAGVELHCWFVPKRPKSFYGSIDLQGEFGSSFQFYMAAFTLGRNF